MPGSHIYSLSQERQGQMTRHPCPLWVEAVNGRLRVCLRGSEGQGGLCQMSGMPPSNVAFTNGQQPSLPLAPLFRVAE